MSKQDLRRNSADPKTDCIDRLFAYIIFFCLASHERTQHGQLHVPATAEERDEFGYYVCRHLCGKTYKTKQGQNRYNSKYLVYFMHVCITIIKYSAKLLVKFN